MSLRAYLSTHRLILGSLVAGVVFVAIFLTGCRPQEEIKTYTVPSTSLPRKPVDVAAVANQLDHILVAILPQQDKVWFFKLVGKAPAIDRHREAFREFLATIKLADSPQDLPHWELPAGWREQASTSALRLATLVISDGIEPDGIGGTPDQDGADNREADESEDLELAVSALNFSGEWEDFLVPNVNRWLGQLRRPALRYETIEKLSQQMATQSGPATLFELSGVMHAPKGMGVHAGIPASAESAKGPSEPASPESSAAQADSKELKYQKPEAWLPGKPSSMRKASFLLPGGGPRDEVVVTSFSAKSPQMANLAPNVRRWAVQVEMESLADAEVEKLAQPISLSGLEGTYVELSSPENVADQRSICVAMVKRQDWVWFFKMSGSSELVNSQKTAFQEFLKSVVFE